MLGNITVAENIYIACEHTNMRKSIDGLAAIVQQQFLLDGRCSLSNNAAENAIRPFTVGRKN